MKFISKFHSGKLLSWMEFDEFRNGIYHVGHYFCFNSPPNLMDRVTRIEALAKINNDITN